MAASNQLTIQITGDESDLKKTLELAAKQISKFSSDTENSGKKGGEGFGSGFAEGARGRLRLVVNQFREIETAATSGFSGVAEAFLTKLVNPVTVGAAAIGASIIGAFAFAKIGEENNRIAATFKRFATDSGLDADRLKEKIAGIAEGFVDLEDVLPRAGEAVLALGKNANRLPEILALARNIGVQTGRDVTQVFEELTKGIENQNIKLLRNNSIRLDGDRVLQEYAKSHGLVVAQLSEAAKQQAFLNAALEQGNKKFGEVGAQAAPIQGGIKKLELAFDDLKDSIAAVVNSGLGGFFASVISGTASATRAVADFFTPTKEEADMTLEERIKATTQLLGDLSQQLSRAKIDAPYLTEQLNKQVLDANTKLMSLTAAQKALEEQSAKAGQLTPEEIKAAPTDQMLEAERQKYADLAAIRAESDAAELQAADEHQVALATIESNGMANTQAVRDAQYQAILDRNEAEFQATVAKNSKIVESDKLAAANLMALKKKEIADQKAADAQAVTDAKLVADAKIAIENNLFAAAKTLIDQQSALGKTIAVAEAIRNTYRGATLALATYPPPFGGIAAASTVALGLAQVAKITAANSGALVTGGQPGQDTNPFLLSKGEIVAPAKSFDEVVEGTARQRGFVKTGEESETNSLLRELIGKLDNRAVAVTVNTDVIADENGINTLVERIRDAIDFNAAPSLG